MPVFTGDIANEHSTNHDSTPYDQLPRKSNDKSLGGVFTLTNGNTDAGYGDQGSEQYRGLAKNQHLSNGTAGNGSIHGRERSHSKANSVQSTSSARGRHMDGERHSFVAEDFSHSRSDGTEKSFSPLPNGDIQHSPRRSAASLRVVTNGETSSQSQHHSPEHSSLPQSAILSTAPEHSTGEPTDYLSVSPRRHRHSSPPAASPNQIAASSAISTMPRLSHRHTLQVPRTSTTRTSRDFSYATTASEDPSGRLSPTHPSHRRGSLGLVRRTTRSVNSDLHLDEVPQDEDAMRWTEAIRQKRASKRKRKEEEDDERVIVGTKVDQSHANWITAYNMLTGIRFTVSRTNAKMDRELTDADFHAKHKFSFDITGNELTPSAKYDFKFKDYAPWVFRHLRSKFGLDPADYLMSLTSKYILSELGSPGKSGSFFYFSRDYKYIIKTIHHAEHKLLRKILHQYYDHICQNPNTLISQFYGLHRVKVPYGRKIHFVVMNNLFPPHRDIHQTFDLKGSTIGRDFREEELEKNPRATLKDLNWLRRNLHLEFGPRKREVFIKQIERDVALLKRLKIMDYSLLVGIHDVNKGNEENLRDKTLRVFQPGGELAEGASSQLTRTPSRMETIRQAQELRRTLQKEKPIPMGMTQSKMPDEILDDRKDRIFYSDDGGFKATHENGRDGEEIYYLGIIDCLTKYGMVKKAEHFWKGLSNNSSQISPIPPVNYGERFVNFITGITMTREEADRQAARRSRSASHGQSVRSTVAGRAIGSSETNRTSGESAAKSPAEKTLERAQKQAMKSERHGKSEADTPDRILAPVRSPGGTSSRDAEKNSGNAGMQSIPPTMILPVVEEKDSEAASTGGRSGRSGRSAHSPAVSTANLDKELPDLPDKVSSRDAALFNPITQDNSLSATITTSPTDFRLDDSLAEKSSQQPPKNPNHLGGEVGLAGLVNGDSMLPAIPHLTPLTAELPKDHTADPEKADYINGPSINARAKGKNHTR